MPEWLILVVVWIVVARFIRRGRGYACGPRPRRHVRSGGERMTSGSTGAGRLASPPAESPMETLQRRFVEGRITVEQYERELDRMLRS